MAINFMPLTTLSNGLTVANFSSPHAFTFEDGTVLGACSNERAQHFSAYVQDEVLEENTNHDVLTLAVTLLDRVYQELLALRRESFEQKIVIILPLMMIQALRNQYGWDNKRLLASPFRTIRMKSRTEKVCCIDKFCI